MKKTWFFWAVGVAVMVALVSCDIGNLSITQSDASRRNIDAFEEIDFLSGKVLTGPRAGGFVEGRVEGTGASQRTVGVGAYPLAFGTSTNNRASAILGGGQRSMRFQNEVFQLGASTIAERGHVEIRTPANPPPGGLMHSLPPGQPLPETVPPGFIEIAATRSGQGGGKVTGSEDGITFLFREVPLDRNFIMEADLLVVSFGNLSTGWANLPHNPGSNGQEAFGLMVRDFVPQFYSTAELDNRTGMANFVLGTTMHGWELNHRHRFESSGGNLLAGMTHDGTLHQPGQSDAAFGQANSGNHHDNASFHYWVGAAGAGADSNMVMAGAVSRGMRTRWRWGITRSEVEADVRGNPTANGVQNSGNFAFRTAPGVLGDYSLFTEEVWVEEAVPGQAEPNRELRTVPTMGARPDFPRWGSTVRVRLERTNDGFLYTITNLDDRFDNWDTDTGQVIGGDAGRNILKPPVTGFIPARDILGMVGRESFYVGIFASRDAIVWAHNIRYWEADSDRTAPAGHPRLRPHEPRAWIASPQYYGGTNYLYVKANTVGNISVTQGGRLIPSRLIVNEWIVETQNGAADPVSLFTIPIFEPTEGDNIFDIVFQPGTTPDVLFSRGYIHSSSASVRLGFNMVRRTLQGGQPGSHIYVAPLPGFGFTVSGDPMGSPEGDGSRGSPLDLQTAINHVMPGQHIVMLNGRYVMDSKLVIPMFNDGTQANRKVLRAYEVNRVWLDWDKNESLTDDRPGVPGIGGEAFLHWGSFWHFDGFHVRGAPDRLKGMVVSGSNNILTRLMFYNNGDTGLQISSSASLPVVFWPRNNLVQWVESFHNMDVAQTNADGVAAKLTSGRGNVFHSVIAHHNNDDGWDFFAKRDTGPIGVVVTRYSIAYRHGNMLNGFETIAGHSGFKMGGEGIPVFHELRHSLAFANGYTSGRGWSVTSNSNPALMVHNVTTARSSGGATRAGNIEVRGGGPAVGNIISSVAEVANRGTGAQLTRPPGNLEYLPDGINTDWRSFMVSRPAEFWGSGYALGLANGLLGTGQVGGGPGGHATAPMPACYSGWTKFEAFFARDEWFAYPLIGDLFQMPAGTTQGASGLHDRCAVESGILALIPWAVRNPNRGY